MSDTDDHEWLVARERGEDVSHVPAATRAAYDRLTRMIEALPDRAPSPGWKQRVLDAMNAPGALRTPGPLDVLRSPGPLDVLRSPGPLDVLSTPGPLDVLRSPGPLDVVDAPRASGVLDAVAATEAPPAIDAPRAPDAPARTLAGRRRTSVIAGAVAAAASVVVVIALRGGGARMAEPIATTEIRHGEDLYRGGEVRIGDTLVVHAEADHPIELRVYGDSGELLARCRETAGCTVVREGARRRYSLEVALRAPGDVRAVLFSVHDTTLPPPQDLEADLAAAHGAHIEARQVAVVHVR